MKLSSKSLAAFLTEEKVLLLAAVAQKVAHILDKSEDRDAHFLEHVKGLAHILHRNFLWRRHQNRARHRHELRERKLHIARSWRHIDDEIIELTPVHFVTELTDNTVKHRTAPDEPADPQGSESPST